MLGTVDFSQSGDIMTSSYISPEMLEHNLETIFENAVRSNQETIVEQILASGREITPGCLGRVFQIASECLNKNVVEQILASKVSISQNVFDTIFMDAVERGQSDVVEKILVSHRPICSESLEYALKITAFNGCETIIKQLLESSREISPGCLGEAFEVAVTNGHEAVVKQILASKRPISQDDFDNTFMDAVEREQNNIVEQILASDRAICPEGLEYALKINTFNGNETIVEQILERGGSRSDLPKRTSNNILECTFEDVKQYPMKYLENLLDIGFPHSIRLSDSNAVDDEGLSKQFIRTLVEALVEKYHFLSSGNQIPTITSDQQDVMKKLGDFVSLLDECNKKNKEKYILGSLFDKHFFDMAIAINNLHESLDKQKAIADILVSKDKVYQPIKDVLNGSEDPEILDVFEACVDMDEGDNHLEKAQCFFNGYLLAVESFMEGMSPNLKHVLTQQGSELFEKRVQGIKVSKEKLLQAIQKEGVAEQHFTWIQEKISQEAEGNTWGRKFVKAITGQGTLSPTTKIFLEQSSEGLFEIHTCFNSISIPSQIDDKDAFFTMLDGILEDEDYNIA